MFQDPLKANEAVIEDGYAVVQLAGALNGDDIVRAADSLKKTADDAHIDIAMFDSRGMKEANINMDAQVKGTAALWKMKDFKKVAFVIDNPRLDELLNNTLETIHLTGKFKSFLVKEDAAAWLKQK